MVIKEDRYDDPNGKDTWDEEDDMWEENDEEGREIETDDD